MKKKQVLITPEVIEECLNESLEIPEKNTSVLKKNTPPYRRTQISSK